MKPVLEEKSVLRWGGLAGILGGILMIFVFIFVGGIIGEDPAGLAGPITRFPDIAASRTVENGLYLLVLLLWVPLFLALHRALRGTSPAAALFGSVLGVVGIAVLVAGALPHVATGPLAELYHAAEATPEDQAGLVLVWQATQGLFDALLIAGLALLPIAIVALGAGMLEAPGFGRGLGWMSMVLGLVGMVATVVLLVDPLSPSIFAIFLAVIVFQVVVGWKAYGVSRVGSGVSGVVRQASSSAG